MSWREAGRLAQDEEESLNHLRYLIGDSGSGGGDHNDNGSAAYLDVVDGEHGTGTSANTSGSGNNNMWETVLIPNRSKSQYIRQTTINGRDCVFQLDAHTWPRLAPNDNSTSPALSSDGTEIAPRAMADKIKWVEGKEGLITFVLYSSNPICGGKTFYLGMEGTLTSPNCLTNLNFTSESIRLDWGRAYRKAVNYSIVVTLVCVLQIGLLFRQLYYSRTQVERCMIQLFGELHAYIRGPHLC